MTTAIRFQRMPLGYDLPLPSRATPGSAGIDMRAARDVTLPPGARSAVPTGFAVDIPEGHEGQVRPRSGWAAKNGLTVLNSPGTIDADYRQEVMVILINHGASPVVIHRGDRIAQLVVAPVLVLPIEEVHEMAETDRVGGFGSTGTR